MTYAKAIGASIIVQKQFEQNNKVFSSGFKKKSNSMWFQRDDVDLDNVVQSVEDQNKVIKANTKCMIFPTNTGKQIWDFIVMVLLLYTALYVPFKVCFVETTSDFGFLLDLVVDFLFLTDIVLTFNTALEESSGLYNVSRGAICKSYCRGWFFIDFLTSLPFQILEKIQPDNIAATGDSRQKMLRLMRIPRLYRLVRILRLFKLLRVFNTTKVSAFTKLFKLSYHWK